ncbi:MAG: hypothetical protein N4A59_05815 [Marinifilum sp.]|nr:hypothetical protein [Marinifilum sp.]
MKNLKAIGALLVLAVSIVSCSNNDFDQTQDPKAIADVFVRCTKIGNDTVYAPVLYTYSNFNMKEVDVNGPTDSNIDEALSQFGTKMVFRSVPKDNDFTKDDVANGIYQFDIIAEDLKTYTISDKLLDKRIDPVTITDFQYDDLQHTIELEWDNVKDRDVYVVKIHDKKDGELIYISDRMKSTSYTIRNNENPKNWSDFKKVEGATYVVGVYAYQFEARTAISGYDVNCESVDYRDIKW